MSTVVAAEQPDAAEVLTRALFRSADKLGLGRRGLARVLGISAASLSRRARGRPLDPDGKEGELAVLVVRLFRSLDAILGGDEDAARQWFHAHNRHLGGTPAELTHSVQGLVHVVEYLDAMRGKI